MAVAVLIGAAIAPDVDFLLGMDHRGPTHSMAFAVGLALAVAIIAAARRRPDVATLGFATFVAATSHVVLDLLTAPEPLPLLWPLSAREISLSLTPLPSAPTTEPLFTRAGLLEAAAELLWSVALVALGLVVGTWRTRRAGGGPAVSDRRRGARGGR